MSSDTNRSRACSIDKVWNNQCAVLKVWLVGVF